MEEACKGSGGLLHKVSKMATRWSPTVVTTAQGVRSARPCDVLGQAKALWTAGQDPEDPRAGITWGKAPEIIPPETWRAVSRSFSTKTAQSFDGFGGQVGCAGGPHPASH